MKKYQHIVFDVDGTLVDTKTANLKALQNALLKVCNQHYDLKTLEFAQGLPGNMVLKKLHITDVENVISEWNHCYSQYSKNIKCFDKIPIILKRLSTQYKLGIITSRHREEFYKETALEGIFPLFKIVVCKEDTIAHKPSDAPIQAYLQRSNLYKSEILYIGDTIYDFSSCKKAGVDFAFATWGNSNNSSKVESAFPLGSPQDLLKVLLD